MSRPTRARILLVLAFVLTLAAGVVVGAGLVRRALAGGDLPKPAGPDPLKSGRPDQRPWLHEQLDLTPDQRAKVDAIWRETNHDKIRQLSEQRRSLYRERDDVIASLYTAEQKAERERLYREYRARETELDRERDAAVDALYTAEQKAKRDHFRSEFGARIDEAGKQRDQLFQPMVDRTRQVLSEDQRKRFDAMLRGGDRDRGGHRGGPSGTRPGTQPSTRDADGSSRPGFDRGGPDGGAGEGGRSPRPR